jgi:hypothetical protein
MPSRFNVMTTTSCVFAVVSKPRYEKMVENIKNRVR